MPYGKRLFVVNFLKPMLPEKMSKRLPKKTKLPVSPAASHQAQQSRADLKQGELPQTFVPPTVVEGTPVISGAKISLTNDLLLESGVDRLPGFQMPTGKLKVALASSTKNVTASDRDARQETPPAVKRKADSVTSAQPRTDGKEPVAGVGVAVDDSPIQQPPVSFIEGNWPYLLIGITLVGWVVSQMFVRREPSFKPPVDKIQNQNRYRNRERRRRKTVKYEKPTGQFKKSDRFVKSKDESKGNEASEKKGRKKNRSKPSVGVDKKLSATEAYTVEGKVTKHKRTNVGLVDQPADDEFDFDLSDDDSDSDVFSSKDAAEITQTADAKKTNASSKRFKTEGEFEVDEDEVGSFDDEDSQLSLADSDTEFGFDLDDEESRGFLDSGKQVAEKSTDVAQDNNENLPNSEPNDTEGVAAVSSPPASRSFLSRIFGFKNKKKKKDDSENAVLNGSESGSSDKANMSASSDHVEQVIDDPDKLDSVESQSVDDSDFDLEFDGLDDSSVSSVTADADSDLEVDVNLDSSDADGSGELSSNLADEDKASDNVVDVAEKNASENPIKKTSIPVEVEAVQSEDFAVSSEDDCSGDDDSGEFGFSLPKDDVTGSEEVTKMNLDAEPSISASAFAIENGVGARSIGTTLASKGSADESDSVVETESVNQWQTKLSTLENEYLKLSSQVTTLMQRLEEAAVVKEQSEFLLREREKLAETVELLGSNKEDLLVEKTRLAEKFAVATEQCKALEQAKAELGSDKEDLLSEKTRLAEEFAVATEQCKALEQEKAELLKQNEELKVEQKAAETTACEMTQLAEEFATAAEQCKVLEQEKAELGSDREDLLSEKMRLAEEVATATEQCKALEQEKAELLKQNEELKAEQKVAEATACEKTQLAEDYAAAAEQCKALEREKAELLKQNEELKAEQRETEAIVSESISLQAKPDCTGSDEDIEDLRERFGNRLQSEYRKRKKAERLIEQAEDQRDEVARLLRETRAEVLELKTQFENDGFDIGD